MTIAPSEPVSSSTVAAASEPSLPPGKISTAELAEYLLDLGGELLSYGCPTYRLEAVIRLAAELEGCTADVFGVPTGLWMSLRGPGGEAPIVRMVRVPEWGVDLARLALVDQIFNDVLDRKYSIAAARKRLDELSSGRPPYPTWLRWAALASAAGASAVFFRGGWEEIAIGVFGGLVLAVLRTFLSKTPQARHLQDFLGGLLAGGLAWCATALRPGLSREVIVLSVVILLVPGMALTTGLAELAHKNLVSGASRLMEALMIFLSILFGIAALIGLEQLLHLSPGISVPRVGFGAAAQGVAILVASFAFGVIFLVPRRYLPLAVVSGTIGWVVTGLGARYFPGALSAFAASASVCFFANGAARITQRPAQVFQLPGLVLLVPGSFGFLSLEAFLRGELLGGATQGFQMFLIAGAIVTGVIVGNVVLPARKLL